MIYRKIWSVPSSGGGPSSIEPTPIAILLGMVSQYSDGPDKLAANLGITGAPAIEQMHMRDDENMYEVQLLFKDGKGSWYCNLCSKQEIVQLLKSEANWGDLESAIEHILTDRVQEFVYQGNDDASTGLNYVRICNKGPISYLT